MKLSNLSNGPENRRNELWHETCLIFSVVWHYVLHQIAGAICLIALSGFTLLIRFVGSAVESYGDGFQLVLKPLEWFTLSLGGVLLVTFQLAISMLLLGQLKKFLPVFITNMFETSINDKNGLNSKLQSSAHGVSSTPELITLLSGHQPGLAANITEENRITEKDDVFDDIPRREEAVDQMSESAIRQRGSVVASVDESLNAAELDHNHKNGNRPSGPAK